MLQSGNLEKALVSMLENLNIKEAKYTMLAYNNCYIAAYSHENERYWTKITLSPESIEKLKNDIKKEFKLKK